MEAFDSDVRRDPLGPAIRWSLFAHGAIAVFILLKSLVFPSDPIMMAPALRVDVVGLPDILRKDLAQVPKALPKESLQEQLEDAAKQAKAIKPIEAPKEEAKPDEMILHPKKEKPAEKADKKEEVKREKKLKSALARIRALERLKDKDEPEEESTESVIIKGNQASKGTSLSGDAKEQAEAGYYSDLRDHLAGKWSLPPFLSRQKLAVKVRITIDRSGTILSTNFVETSGNKQFDDEVRRTLKDAQPLPRPPAKLADSLADDGILVGFPL